MEALTIGQLFRSLYEDLVQLEVKINAADHQIQLAFQGHEDCQRIGAVEGIGPLTATAIVAAISNGRAFANGRQFAAWLGLVPRQNSSGGKTRLMGISKRGDPYLRTLLIHAARSVRRCVLPGSELWRRHGVRRGYPVRVRGISVATH